MLQYIHKKIYAKIVHISVLILVLAYSLFYPLVAVYASTLTVSVSTTTLVENTATNIIITFTLINAIAADGYINIHFPAGTTMQSELDYTDVDVLVNEVNRTLDAYTTTTFSGYDAISINVADPNSLLMQIVPESTGSGYAASSTFTLKIGTNTTYQHVGDKQYKNGAAGTATYQIVSRNVSNAEIDSGSKNITLIVAVPEFSTYVFISTLIVGGWYVHSKIKNISNVTV